MKPYRTAKLAAPRAVANADGTDPPVAGAGADADAGSVGGSTDPEAGGAALAGASVGAAKGAESAPCANTTPASFINGDANSDPSSAYDHKYTRCVPSYRA